MSTKQPASPRRMRVSGRATERAPDNAEMLVGDGLRLRLRLSPADASLLEALRGEDEDSSATIRRLIRTASLFSVVSSQIDQLTERLATIEARGLAPAPTPEEPDALPPETDDVTLQKQAIARFLGSDDDEDDPPGEPSS